jgi:hypothetical protein
MLLENPLHNSGVLHGSRFFSISIRLRTGRGRWRRVSRSAQSIQTRRSRRDEPLPDIGQRDRGRASALALGIRLEQLVDHGFDLEACLVVEIQLACAPDVRVADVFVARER